MPTNLLPITYREALLRDRYRKIAIVLGIYMAFALLVWIALLLPSFIFLYYQTDAVQTSTQGTTVAANEAKELRREINGYNRSILRLQNVSTTGIVPILSVIIGADEEDTRFTSITFDRATKIAQIDGSADTRSALEDLVERLNAEERIAKASAPVENFLGSKNIRFTITVEFAEYE